MKNTTTTTLATTKTTTPVKKSRSKKVTPVTAVAPVTPVTPVTTTAVVESTTTAVKPVANKSVTNKLLSFDDTMSLMSECGIGSKSKTKNYRIMNGGSSIHVLKTKYRIYMTPIDFELCGKLKTSDIQLLENDNAVDVKRPHTVICSTVDTLKKVFECISANKLNAPC